MGIKTPEDEIKSAEELYRMVSEEVPVLREFHADFLRDAAGYLEHEMIAPVDGLPRYIGGEVDESSFGETVDDAVLAMGFMRVRDRQLENMVQELDEMNQYRVLEDGGVFRGSEARSALGRQRVSIGSVNSELKAVSGILDSLEDVPCNPLQESRRMYLNREGHTDGKIIDETDFQEPRAAYWPFDS